MTTTYQIKRTRHYYGPRIETAILTDALGYEMTFATRAAARAEIIAREEHWWRWPELAHAEHSSPTYRVVRSQTVAA